MERSDHHGGGQEHGAERQEKAPPTPPRGAQPPERSGATAPGAAAAIPYLDTIVISPVCQSMQKPRNHAVSGLIWLSKEIQ